MNYTDEDKPSIQNKSVDLFIRLAAIVIFIVVIIVTVYRYSLIDKAIGKEQYITALALSSPEVGTGLSTIMNGLF